MLSKKVDDLAGEEQNRSQSKGNYSNWWFWYIVWTCQRTLWTANLQ